MKHISRKIFKRVASWRHLDLAVLGIGIVGYAAQVFSTMGKWSIWFDEAFSSYLIRFNFAEIAHFTSVDVHPPLYYWTLKLWTMLFGTTDIALRSLSLVFGVAVIVFGFLIMRRLFGRRAAFIAVLLLAISPMLIRYGQETRMYAMTAAISMAATYVLMRAMASKKRLPWIIYGVLVAAGMWTHYFTAVFWIAHWVWRAAALYIPKQKFKKYAARYFSKQWVGSFVLAILLFVPWMPSMFHQLFDIQSGWFWIQPVGADTFTNYVTTILFFQQHDQLGPWTSVLFYIVLIMLIVLAVIAFKKSKGVMRTHYLLIAILTFVPVVLVFVASLPPLRPSFIERYLMPSIVMFSLFASMIIVLGTAKLKVWIQVLCVALIAASMIIGVVHAQTIGNFNKSANVSIDTKQVIAEIAKRSSGTEPIISRTPWVFYEAVFYETKQNPVYYLDSTLSVVQSGALAMLQGDDSHKIRDSDAFAKAHPTVWYFGEPGDLDITDSYTGWTVIQSFRVDDPITGLKRYQAVQYDTRSTKE